MMATPHLFAGAALGAVLRRPLYALPAALASHFLLDCVPHVDAHSLFGQVGASPTPREAAFAVGEFLVAMAVLIYFTRHRRDRALVLGAALMALLPDLIDVSPGLGPTFRIWSLTQPLYAFHHGIQPRPSSDHLFLGLVFQVLTIAVAGWIIWRTARLNSPQAGVSPVSLPPPVAGGG